MVRGSGTLQQGSVIQDCILHDLKLAGVKNCKIFRNVIRGGKIGTTVSLLGNSDATKCTDTLPQFLSNCYRDTLRQNVLSYRMIPTPGNPPTCKAIEMRCSTHECVFDSNNVDITFPTDGTAD